MVAAPEKLTLHGFNNLTKTLSFNIYDICYANTAAQQHQYIEYIDEEYNALRLTRILEEVTKLIGANILNVARQDYDPQGASVTLLISEQTVAAEEITNKEAPGPLPDSIVGHLDKSHITVHTYPETHPEGAISTFRVDIDVSTCGRVSPLQALNYLIHSFDSDIVIMDYRVRGFTRDIHGKKHFMDHNINSIQNFIGEDIKKQYQLLDVNVYQENIFHTKMMVNEFELDNYLFGIEQKDLAEQETARIYSCVQKEMREIFYGRNILNKMST